MNLFKLISNSGFFKNYISLFFIFFFICNLLNTKSFANNYLNDDVKKAEHCLKDSYLLHKWNKIQQNLQPVGWKTDLTEKTYVDVDTLGAAACAGGACEIDF